MGCCGSTLKPHTYENVQQKETIAVDGFTLDVSEEGFSKRAIAYVNPISGSGKGLKVIETIKKIFKDNKVDLIVRQTEYKGHLVEMARDEALDKVNYLCAVGGDGTYGEMLNGFMIRPDVEEVKGKVALCVIPAGTGNTMAYDLQILSPEDAAEKIVANKARLIDCMEMTFPGSDKTPIYSANIMGWGIPAGLLNTYESLRCIAVDCLRGSLYTVAGYSQLISNRVYSAKIEFPESTKIDPEIRDILANPKGTDLCWVQVQTTVFTGDKLATCPLAVVDDGLIDLVIMKHASRLTLVGVADMLTGGQIHECKDAYYIQTPEFTLTPTNNECAGANTVNVDGDLQGISPFKVRTLERVITICC